MLESVNMVCPGCIWIVVPCYNEGTEKRGIERNGSCVSCEITGAQRTATCE